MTPNDPTTPTYGSRPQGWAPPQPQEYEQFFTSQQQAGPARRGSRPPQGGAFDPPQFRPRHAEPPMPSWPQRPPKKRHTVRNVILALAIIVLSVIITNVSNGGSNSPSGSTTQPPAAAATTAPAATSAPASQAPAAPQHKRSDAWGCLLLICGPIFAIGAMCVMAYGLVVVIVALVAAAISKPEPAWQPVKPSPAPPAPTLRQMTDKWVQDRIAGGIAQAQQMPLSETELKALRQTQVNPQDPRYN